MEHLIREVMIAFGTCVLSIGIYFFVTLLLSIIISGDAAGDETLSWILGGVAFMFLALFCAHLAGLVTF